MSRFKLFAIGIASTVAALSGLPAEAQVIQRIGDVCPYGYYASGDFCKALSSKSQHAIPNPGGGQCPFGYHASGFNYCLKNR